MSLARQRFPATERLMEVAEPGPERRKRIAHWTSFGSDDSRIGQQFVTADLLLQNVEHGPAGRVARPVAEDRSADPMFRIGTVGDEQANVQLPIFPGGLEEVKAGNNRRATIGDNELGVRVVRRRTDV